MRVILALLQMLPLVLLLEPILLHRVRGPLRSPSPNLLH